MRILLAEDDALLGDGLRAGLRQLGFQVDWVRDGAAAERELRAQPYAAAVLDLGLPLMDGMEVLAAVRRAGVTLPVLVLTARDAVPDRIRGLDLGADDYVVKPVDLNELAARLRALVRRAHGQPQERLTVQDVVLDPAARPVHRGGTPVTLAAREFDLLHALMLNAGRVLSREQLEQHLVQLGPRSREQRHRSPHPPPAQQARQRADPDRARRRLRDAARDAGMSAKPRSLQGRLLLLVLGVVAAVWLVAAALIWRDVRHELDELLDGHLAQAAALLVVQQAGRDRGRSPRRGRADAAPLRAQGGVPGLPRGPPRAALGERARAADGGRGRVHQRLSHGGHRRHAPGACSPRAAPSATCRCTSSEQVASRSSILWAVLRRTLWPMLLALPVLALAVVVGDPRRHARRCARSGTLLAARRADALEPVALADAPREMVPMLDALNALFQRIAGLLDAERRFTADAAHELRTPIAAIRAQAQVALAEADDCAAAPRAAGDAGGLRPRDAAGRADADARRGWSRAPPARRNRWTWPTWRGGLPRTPRRAHWTSASSSNSTRPRLAS